MVLLYFIHIVTEENEMKYIEKYNRYVDDDLVIYRWDKSKDKLIQVKPSVSKIGYQFICYAAKKTVYVHRLVYEAFIGEIPTGYEIDHINTIKVDNRPENLRLVTHKENYNNELTIKHLRESHKGQINRGTTKGKIWSEFGEKFKEHFGITRSDNLKLYKRELNWYHSHHKKCSWEK